jgi:hypothetical protein
MVDVPAEVERTFVRLWTHCDDEGRAKDNPRLIKAALFPLLDDMTAEVVDEHLEELAKRDLIVRYEVDGVRYLSIPSWSRWQHPQKKRPSDLPEPPDPSEIPLRDSSRTAPVVIADESGPVVGGGVVDGEGAGVTPSLPALVDKPVDPLLGFDEFWTAYPARNGKKVNRGVCETKWRTLSLDDRRAAWRGAVNYATAVASGLTIAKDPERFLKHRVWVDYLDGPGYPDRPTGSVGNDGLAAAHRFIGEDA